MYTPDLISPVVRSYADLKKSIADNNQFSIELHSFEYLESTKLLLFAICTIFMLAAGVSTLYSFEDLKGDYFDYLFWPVCIFCVVLSWFIALFVSKWLLSITLATLNKGLKNKS
jgi:hypothetical protein